MRHADLPVVLDDLHGERVREVRLRTLDARGLDLDQDVLVVEARGQVELVVALALGQLLDPRFVRADVAELPRVRLDEGVPREEELEVHQVVVHAAFGDVLVVEPDALRLDGELEPGLRRRERGLPLRAVLLVDDGRLLALDLVELREHIEEEPLPLRHGVVPVALRDPARATGIAR